MGLKYMTVVFSEPKVSEQLQQREAGYLYQERIPLNNINGHWFRNRFLSPLINISIENKCALLYLNYGDCILPKAHVG